MRLDAFVTLRPRLYHLTAQSNVERVLRKGILRSASELFEAAGEAHRSRARRRGHERVKIADEWVHIRDQAPLHAGNMALMEGWSYDDFVEHVNRHVFFWPGDLQGPIDYGLRHFQRYLKEDVAVLSVSTSGLIAANPDRAPLFSAYNSGSPRCVGGLKSPRGPQTYLPPEQFAETPGRVIEFVFPDRVVLPADVSLHHPGEFLKPSG
ncbi:MAG: hypothetical protein AB7G17_12770 [Phycisphaerales bacterium]